MRCHSVCIALLSLTFAVASVGCARHATVVVKTKDAKPDTKMVDTKPGIGTTPNTPRLQNIAQNQKSFVVVSFHFKTTSGKATSRAISGFAVGNLGTGSLTVFSGGSVTVAADGINNLDVGAAAGGSGAVVVLGAGSSLVTTGIDNTVQVGRVGAGTLVAASGGRIETLKLPNEHERLFNR